MSPFRLLIVENESIVSNKIERYLDQHRHRVVGIASSYAEAKALYVQEQPDLVLLDVALNGDKTGIDFACFLRKQATIPPFIFLTNCTDESSMYKIKKTFPDGFLCKPIQKASLYATIEIALYNHQAQENDKPVIQLFNGRRYYLIPVDDILYVQAEHIYVRINLIDDQKFLPRITLKELLEQLPQKQFIRTHRSYIININQAERWDQEKVYVEDTTIPISRSRRKEVLSYLEKN